MTEEVKRVYAFGKDAQGNNVTEGNTTMKAILGGKGANLAEMANIGLPVPPGFTITCQTCMEYANAENTWPAGALDTIQEYREDLETRMGKKIGDAEDPLLVSVRSGAPMSMPGMMDTVLNLGLNDQSINGLIKQTDNPRFAWDSYRRFIQMFSNVVMNLDGDLFENAITAMKHARGVASDTDLSADDLQELVSEFKQIFAENVNAEEYPSLVVDGTVQFPQDPSTQLQLAIEAVFGSWNNPRATLYRKQNKIADDLGTAVNVQSMVFGNKGNTSATGVAFTRNPANGEKEFYGDYLVNAQGEDVVAGIRNTSPIADLKNVEGLEEAGRELEEVFVTLENHFRDMCDIEFTIEQGKLWMLQTRVGKRTATAALRIAIEMVEEGLITREEAVSRIDPAQLDQLLHPQFDASKKYEALATGLNASPGAAVGEVVFSSDDAVARANEGYKVILVRWETNPDDLKGMVAAEGILTSHGGKTSHAAVIARGMGTPCVCGVERFHIDAAEKVVRIEGSDRVLREGDVISIDGTQGIVVDGAVDLVSAELTGDLDTILSWADEIRLDETCGHANHVRVNADNPEDAALALEFGAEAIGLCRTEHMFFEGDRIKAIREMIVAKTPEARKAALDKILPYQQGDFEAMYRVLEGRPMTVRFLDPPLHEFVPQKEEDIVELAGELKISVDELKAVIAGLHEFNPMMGHRGCRLAVTYPEIAEMQTTAVINAALAVNKEHPEYNIVPEIMIPLVGEVKELKFVKDIVTSTADKLIAAAGSDMKYHVGTMIEIPRAALLADEIAKEAEFFSFGTNDLTQMTFGFSRDDAAKFLGAYYENKIYESDPFQHLDQIGVGKLVKMAAHDGRETRPDLGLGICGEHGGDPTSVEFCHNVGLDYVSCSPFRVPIARLAAAQAAIKNPRK